MTTKLESFSDNLCNFIQTHKLLCVLTLGLAIVGFCVGALAGHTVAWLQHCFGCAKKTDDLYAQFLNLLTTPQEAQPLDKASVTILKTTSVDDLKISALANNLAPASPIERTNEQVWKVLAERSKLRCATLDYLSMEEVEHRYYSPFNQKGIRCPRKTAITLDGKFLHANIVGEGVSTGRYVASQTPMEKERYLFWKAVFDGEHVIIDLTTHEDQALEDVKYYPIQEGETLQFGNLSITLERAEDCIQEYQITDGTTSKKITRYNFYTWRDHHALSVKALDQLVETLKRLYGKQPKWVHCLAGAGRTGVLIAAMIIKEKFANGEIRKDNMDEFLMKLILDLREQRGEAFVSQFVQFSLLRDYCKHLISPESP